MERLRFPFPRLPRLLAAAVIVECCARLCPGLGTGTGSAIPCARPGERCRTGPERGAGTGPAPTPEAVGQPRTGAELPPFPGTPNGTAEPPSPPGSPQAGGEGTGPTAWGGTATQHLGLLLAAGSEGPSPPPALGSPPGTDPAGNVTAGGATTPQGTPSHSPSSATVPGSAGGQGGTPSTPPGWSPTGTGLALRQGGSHSPSPPEPWAGEGPGATVSRGDSSKGTHLSVSLAKDSPVPGTMGTSPFGAAAGLTWGPPTHLPTMAPAPPQQPTDLPGTLGHRGGPGSPPASGDAELVQPPSSPGGWPDADTPQVTPAPAAAGRAPRVFIVEDQPPLLRASLLRIPCELVLDMGFVPALQDPGSHERRGLLHSFNRTVVPLFMSVPGFLRLEVTGIREGSVVLQYDALFAAERVPAPGLGALLDAALGSGSARPGLAVGTAPVLRHVALERPLDPCALLFACRAGFTCVAGADGNATCTSLCHRDYCKNHGICTHPRDRGPLCQCPVGSDFWFVGLRCDYRVTQQSLLGVAAGVLLSIVLLGAVVAAVAIRRFKALLLEARAEQSRSSYRRFCRLDDLSARYWSRSWLPSASSLDNPAFSNSEELLHLRILDSGCCGCRGDAAASASAKQRPPARPSSHYAWDTSSSTMNDPMVDSGKASDISVSSWPLEPGQWGPFPLLHQLSRQRPHRARRPRSHGEGLELGSLERSWTA
ncbi:uncharacterized protein LOC116965303 [Tyto alba]|uniref:uncharacterized protein LOC116965303 n=1 Tax=Tyto alba TaxID=56313 RepID=UPI001C66A3D5|nr:uncharacterized protein LOC116965303 [Tyto alba]